MMERTTRESGGMQCAQMVISPEDTIPFYTSLESINVGLQQNNVMQLPSVYPERKVLS